MNSSKSNTFFRGGYVTSLDAWKRYLADGHNIHIRTRHDPGSSSDEDEDEDDDDDNDDDNDDGEDDSEDDSEDEQQTGRPQMSEEDGLLKERVDAEFMSRARQAFRSLYRKAPLEVRTSLVLPHTFTRIVKSPQGDNSYERHIFIPTSWGTPSTRNMGPVDIDRERIQTFIDGANSLIEDDARREAGGFKLTEPDFKFERMPDWAVYRPPLSSKELKDLINAGPQAVKLWGLAPREFFHPYVS